MTITATPPAFSSVHGDLIYTVTDPHTADPGTYPNYKFIADVYIGADLVARIKKVPNPVTLVGVFNIGQIVRNYVSAKFAPDPTAIIAQVMNLGQFYIGVTVVFGEEYGFTEYTGLSADAERLFFNSYTSKRYSVPFSDLAHPPSYTDRPLDNIIRCDSQFNFFPVFREAAPSDVFLEFFAQDNSETYNFYLNFTDKNENDLIILNLSRSAILAISPFAIDDNTKYFTATLGGTTYKFTFDCECIHDVYSVHFLNRYGGFETKDFNKVSRNTVSIEKKSFGRLPYSVDGSGAYSYQDSPNVYNESQSVYSSQFKEKMLLNSDFVTDEEYRWLRQLVVSPLVYIEINGEFFPISITDTSYEEKKVINDDLTNLAITIEFGNQLNAQYR